MSFYDPNTKTYFEPIAPREVTLQALAFHQFKDDADKIIEWTPGQLEIIDCIINRSSPDSLQRIEIIAATQYGKSLAVAAGVVVRASLKPEKWAIVAGTTEKARIIMEYVVMFALNSDMIRSQLTPETSLDRLRMKKSADKLTFRKKGEVRVYSAEARLIAETSKSLMGFGSPNVIEDESSLIGDLLQATVMRMLGGSADNFLVKIGNPFNRNHFLKTWIGGKYHRIFIDYQRALEEGRFTQAFIEEMMDQPMFDILYGCVFPGADAIDAAGWLPLLTEDEISRAFVDDDNLFGNRRLGNDVAGAGRNYSVIVLRAFNLAKKMYKENEPDTMKFATKIMAFARTLGVKDKNLFIDSVGVGKGAYDNIHSIKPEAMGVEGGREPRDPRFANLRAEMYWRAREWILHGGKLERDTDWLQLTNVKYKVADGTGKLKIMSKEEMLKNGIDSPDVADSLAMTFAREEDPPETQQQVVEEEISMDPYE